MTMYVLINDVEDLIALVDTLDDDDIMTVLQALTKDDTHSE